MSTLSRIDPATKQVAAENRGGAGFGGVRVRRRRGVGERPEKSVMTRVDAKTNTATDTIAVGPGPRFLTVGAGAVWTLNQGDGTVSSVDMKTRKLVTNIDVGLPGTGGELAFGDGHVWATVFQIPLSKIDPATNQVVKQWGAQAEIRCASGTGRYGSRICGSRTSGGSICRSCELRRTSRQGIS